MSVDIFKEGKEMIINWAKFQKVGDGYQGTYIGVIRNHDDGKFGPQHVYQLLQEDGSIVNVGLSVRKLKFHKMMSGIAFGQIIGIKYSGDRPTDQGNDSKQFSIFQDPKIVDEKWIAEQEEIKKLRDGMPSDGAPVLQNDEVQEEEALSGMDAMADDPFEDTPEIDTSTTAGKISEISRLAKEKLDAEAGPQLRQTVVDAVGLEFKNENLDKIIEELNKF